MIHTYQWRNRISTDDVKTYLSGNLNGVVYTRSARVPCPIQTVMSSWPYTWGRYFSLFTTVKLVCMLGEPITVFSVVFLLLSLHRPNSKQSSRVHLLKTSWPLKFGTAQRRMKRCSLWIEINIGSWPIESRHCPVIDMCDSTLSRRKQNRVLKTMILLLSIY